MYNQNAKNLRLKGLTFVSPFSKKGKDVNLSNIASDNQRGYSSPQNQKANSNIKPKKSKMANYLRKNTQMLTDIYRSYSTSRPNQEQKARKNSSKFRLNKNPKNESTTNLENPAYANLSQTKRSPKLDFENYFSEHIKTKEPSSNKYLQTENIDNQPKRTVLNVKHERTKTQDFLLRSTSTDFFEGNKGASRRDVKNFHNSNNNTNRNNTPLSANINSNKRNSSSNINGQISNIINNFINNNGNNNGNISNNTTNTNKNNASISCAGSQINYFYTQSSAGNQKEASTNINSPNSNVLKNNFMVNENNGCLTENKPKQINSTFNNLKLNQVNAFIDRNRRQEQILGFSSYKPKKSENANNNKNKATPKPIVMDKRKCHNKSIDLRVISNYIGANNNTNQSSSKLCHKSSHSNNINYNNNNLNNNYNIQYNNNPDKTHLQDYLKSLYAKSQNKYQKGEILQTEPRDKKIIPKINQEEINKELYKETKDTTNTIKARKGQSIDSGLSIEANGIDCPEEYHFFYVSVVQNGKDVLKGF